MSLCEPTISIVIPTKDRPDELIRALTSVSCEMDEHNYDIEVVVSNDGSQKPYPDLKKIFGFKKYKYIENGISCGVSTARNRAIEAASGEWIMFLDDDDEIFPGYINRVISLAKQEVSIKVFWSGVEVISRHKNKIDLVRNLKYICVDFEDKAHLYQELFSSGTSNGLTVHRTVFEDIGLFDESFAVGEDTELFFRFLTAGYKPKPIDGVGVIKHEENDNRLSFNFKEYSRNHVYERILHRYKNDFFELNYCNYVQVALWAFNVHKMSANKVGQEAMFKLLCELGMPDDFIEITDKHRFNIPNLNRYIRKELHNNNFADVKVQSVSV